MAMEYKLIEFETFEVDEKYIFIEFATNYDLSYSNLKAHLLLPLDYVLVSLPIIATN